MAGFSLSPRLLLCGELVPQDAYLADVGTDHAYLVIHLLCEGRIRRAVCADINEGPLRRARENVGAAGFLEYVDFRLTDGAAELSELGADAYSICGMGGELIADIISRAPALRSEKISLVLQPMTRPEFLRAYLFESGFDIIEERCCREGGRYYAVFLARYDGKRREPTGAELYFGKLPKRGETVNADRLSYIRHRARVLSSVIEGKRKGNESVIEEEELLSSVSEYL